MVLCVANTGLMQSQYYVRRTLSPSSLPRALAHPFRATPYIRYTIDLVVLRVLRVLQLGRTAIFTSNQSQS